jgi:hypothetical protein
MVRSDVDSKLISVLVALAVTLSFTRGPIAHAADGSVVELVGVAVGPLGTLL